jgi:hypothetical protein
MALMTSASLGWTMMHIRNDDGFDLSGHVFEDDEKDPELLLTRTTPRFLAQNRFSGRRCF